MSDPAKSNPPGNPDGLRCGKCGSVDLRSTFEGKPPHTHRLTCAACKKAVAIRLRWLDAASGVTDGIGAEEPTGALAPP